MTTNFIIGRIANISVEKWNSTNFQMNNNEDHFILFDTYCKCKAYNDLFTEPKQSEFH